MPNQRCAGAGRLALLLIHLAIAAVKSSNVTASGVACLASKLPRQFANRSVLLLGDSLDRNALVDVCAAYNATTADWLPITLLNDNVRYLYCRLPTHGGGSFTIANFMHFGNSATLPMYKAAYIASAPACGTGLGATSKDHVLVYAPHVREALPKHHPTPTLVVAQSYLWDLAQASQNGHSFNALQLTAWANETRSLLLLLLHNIFPCSAIAWRTAPPAYGRGRSPGANSAGDAKRNEDDQRVEIEDVVD